MCLYDSVCVCVHTVYNVRVHDLCIDVSIFINICFVNRNYDKHVQKMMQYRCVVNQVPADSSMLPPCAPPETGSRRALEPSKLE